MFHDQTFLGWLATGLYVAAAALCAIAARWPAHYGDLAASERRRVACFWWLLAAGLSLLAMNKQLDAQTLLTDRLRDAAERDGWYRGRRMWQVIFVVAAGALAAAGLWGVHRLLGRRWRQHRLALAGTALLLIYLLLRVADIERLGEITGMPLAALRVRSVCEVGGLLLLGVSAWRWAVVGPPSGSRPVRRS